MNNPYSHMKRRQIKKQFKTNSIVNSDPKQNQPGLDPHFLYNRRQNYLNTGYKARKNKLQEITTANKKIYVRINSQKTSYSRAQMNKSYQSNNSISRRLSQSKISKRNSSRSSMRSSQVNHKPKSRPAKNKAIQIQTKSVSGMKAKQVQAFKKLFTPNENNRQNLNERRKSMGAALIRNNVVLPQIKDHSVSKKSNPSMAHRIPLSCKNEGGFLHKIAEEMFGTKKSGGKNNVTIH